MEEETMKVKKLNLGYMAVSFLLVFVLSLLVLFFVESQVRSAKFEELMNSEERLIMLQNDFLGKEFETVLGDLHYLHYAYENQLNNLDGHEAIGANWTHFSTERKIYDQIRFIDAKGNEKIRVNFGNQGGYLVEASKLQNKKDRYYFYEAAKLEKGSVHVSPLDLNVENGQIEDPPKPMIRFSMPVYGEDGTFSGVIVLNYLAQNLLNSFRELSLSSQGEMILLNDEGYWLSSPDVSQEWNFMYEDRMERTFAAAYPTEWAEVLKGKGQMITDRGLLTFSPVDLANKMGGKGDGNWYIISTVLRNQTHNSLFVDNKLELLVDVFRKNLVYFLLMLAVSMAVATLVYLNRKTHDRIKYYSEYDPLTKVFNRRAGINQLNRILPGDERRPFALSLCFIDINGLKQVNDQLGHKSGDELIVSIAQGIQGIIREGDFVVRMGGDEFLIVFKGVDAVGAEKVWHRITLAFEEINEKENRPYVISVSHGIVDFSKSQKSQLDDLIKAADEKMYAEKREIKEHLDVIR